MKNKYFYVEVTKRNSFSDGMWYNDFIGSVFLVKPDSSNRRKYVLADGCSWIDKKDASRIEINTWRPTD